jgi:hypothetical protein
MQGENHGLINAHFESWDERLRWIAFDIRQRELLGSSVRKAVSAVGKKNQVRRKGTIRVCYGGSDGRTWKGQCALTDIARQRAKRETVGTSRVHGERFNAPRGWDGAL